MKKAVFVLMLTCMSGNVSFAAEALGPVEFSSKAISVNNNINRYKKLSSQLKNIKSHTKRTVRSVLRGASFFQDPFVKIKNNIGAVKALLLEDASLTESQINQLTKRCDNLLIWVDKQAIKAYGSTEQERHDNIVVRKQQLEGFTHQLINVADLWMSDIQSSENAQAVQDSFTSIKVGVNEIQELLSSPGTHGLRQMCTTLLSRVVYLSGIVLAQQKFLNAKSSDLVSRYEEMRNQLEIFKVQEVKQFLFWLLDRNNGGLDMLVQMKESIEGIRDSLNTEVLSELEKNKLSQKCSTLLRTVNRQIARVKQSQS